VAPELPNRVCNCTMQTNLGFRRQIVEQRCGLIEEKWQVILDACGKKPLADILVDAALGGVTLEFFSKAYTECRSGSVVRRKLTRRQQTHVVDFIDAALGIDIERSNAIHFVIEQVDPVR